MITCGRPTRGNDSGFNPRISQGYDGMVTRQALTSTEGSNGRTHNSPPVVPNTGFKGPPVVPNTVCVTRLLSEDLLSSGLFSGPRAGWRVSRRRRKCPPGEKKHVNTQTETEVFLASRMRSVRCARLESGAARDWSAGLPRSGGGAHFYWLMTRLST